MQPAIIAKAASLLHDLGEDVSIRAVCRVLQSANGKAARWSQVRAVIKAWECGEFTERATPGQQSGNTFTREGQQTVPARDNCKLELASDSKESSAGAVKGDKKPRQGGLDFEQRDARRAIYKAIWKRVQPAIGRTITFETWCKRNSLAAKDLVRLGFTPEQVERAWELASERIGEPVRMLSIVQDEFGRVAAKKAALEMAAHG